MNTETVETALTSSAPGNGGKTAWIETYSGKRFDILDPQLDSIVIDDIAHALSNQCRYTGHVRRFYSVAEHCILASYLVGDDPEMQMWALLHDASEAYVCDLSRPVKQLTPVGPPYLEVEAVIMRAIQARFDLHPRFETGMPDAVKKADNFMLFKEKDELMTELSWENDASSNMLNRLSLEYPKELLGKVKIHALLPVSAERAFLSRYIDIAIERRLKREREKLDGNTNQLTHEESPGRCTR